MANTRLFPSATKFGPPADTLNSEFSPAYSLGNKAALANLVAVGCLNNTFYIGGSTQLDDVLALSQKIDSQFLAKAAVYARTKSYMKDMPALLAAILATKEKPWLEHIFPIVIDNGKMLRNFCQIIRSGKVGRKSFGTRIKKIIQSWIQKSSDKSVFAWSVGNNPSIADIIRMVHPKPLNKEQNALYAYLLGRDYLAEDLPTIVKQYESFKVHKVPPAPEVPFQMLASLNLGDEVWKDIARNAKWMMTRMNINSFDRHRVFEDDKLTQIVADRLRDAGEVKKSRAFPYQLLTSYKNIDPDVPNCVKEALQDAMEFAVYNTPSLPGKVYVFVDVSGSMNYPVTGYRGTASSNTRLVEVAALFASAILRKNPNTVVWPFNGKVLPVTLNPRDTVLTNAEFLAKLCGNGTNLSAPMAKLNQHNSKPDLVIYLSDNESWMDGPSSGMYNNATATMGEWCKLKCRCPNAKLVCCDFTPNCTTQASEQKDIYNISGFGDEIFNILSLISSNEITSEHWVGEIEKMEI